MTEFALLLPEIILLVTVLGIMVSEVGYHQESVRLVVPTALLGFGGAFIQTLFNYRFGAEQIFGGTLSADSFSLFFKLLAISLGVLTIIASSHSKEIADDKRAEFSAFVVAYCLGICLVSAATDLILVFVGLQCLNVLGYLLSAYQKNSVRSTEAAVKYLAFGVTSAGLFLFGVAILFASTQSVNIYEINRALVATPLPSEASITIFILIFSALAFQLAAFPMQLWAPDVLEGAPTPVSAFLSVGSRVAGFAVSLRVLIALFARPALELGRWRVLGGVDWTQVIGIAAGISLISGAALAFRQKSAKRMVANLVVAETGFLLLGLLVLDEVGVAALLYNLVVDLFALTGAFYCISFLVDRLRSDHMDDLRGALGGAVPECIALLLFLGCLVGVPPLPGFVGKFVLIGAAIRHQWYLLAALAIGSSALSLIAVSKLAQRLVGDFRQYVGATFKDSSKQELRQRRIFLVSLLLPMGLVGVFADRVLSWAGQSLRFIFW